MKRIVVLPEEFQVIVNKLEKVEQSLQRAQCNIEDPILNSEDVMTLLKLSRRTLQSIRDERLIEFSQINGKFFYRMSAVTKMLEKHLQTTM